MEIVVWRKEASQSCGWTSSHIIPISSECTSTVLVLSDGGGGGPDTTTITTSPPTTTTTHPHTPMPACEVAPSADKLELTFHGGKTLNRLFHCRTRISLFLTSLHHFSSLHLILIPHPNTSSTVLYEYRTLQTQAFTDSLRTQ